MIRIRHLLLYTIGASALIFASGCVSLEHAFDEEPMEIYGGTTRAWIYITDNSKPVFGSLVRTVDFPFTVILDTILLPVSIPVELTR